MELSADLVSQQTHLPVPSAAARLGPHLQGTYSAIQIGSTAVIPIVGPIFPHDNILTRIISAIFGATVIELLVNDFKAASDNPQVSSIAFYVNSPGGRVEGTNEFANLVFNSTKPTATYAFGTLASGSYWIGSSTDKVYVDAASLVGSIGVALGVRKNTDPNDFEIISSQSPDKRLDPATESGQAKLQKLANDTADVFIGAVARNRNVSVETVMKKFGGGALLVGQLAVNAGLADEVASFDQALQALSSGDWKKRKRPRMVASSQATEDTVMSDKDKKPGILARLFGRDVTADEQKELAEALKADSGEAAPPVTQPPAQAAQTVAQPASMGASEELKRIQAELETERNARFKSEAEAFANSLIGADGSRQAFPYEREQIVADYIAASQDDVLSPRAVTYFVKSEAKQGTRVDALKARYAERPSHNLASEFIPFDATTMQALNAGGSAQQQMIDAARKQGEEYAAQANRKPN